MEIEGIDHGSLCIVSVHVPAGYAGRIDVEGVDHVAVLVGEVALMRDIGGFHRSERSCRRSDKTRIERVHVGRVVKSNLSVTVGRRSLSALPLLDVRSMTVVYLCAGIDLDLGLCSGSGFGGTTSLLGYGGRLLTSIDIFLGQRLPAGSCGNTFGLLGTGRAFLTRKRVFIRVGKSCDSPGCAISAGERVDDLGGLNDQRHCFKPLDNGSVFLLVPLAPLFRRCGIKHVHAWPKNSLEFAQIVDGIVSLSTKSRQGDIVSSVVVRQEGVDAAFGCIVFDASVWYHVSLGSGRVPDDVMVGVDRMVEWIAQMILVQ